MPDLNGSTLNSKLLTLHVLSADGKYQNYLEGTTKIITSSQNTEYIFHVCIYHITLNCKETTCNGFSEILVVNESDVKQTKSISNKPLSILRQNW